MRWRYFWITVYSGYTLLRWIWLIFFFLTSSLKLNWKIFWRFEKEAINQSRCRHLAKLFLFTIDITLEHNEKSAEPAARLLLIIFLYSWLHNGLQCSISQETRNSSFKVFAKLIRPGQTVQNIRNSPTFDKILKNSPSDKKSDVNRACAIGSCYKDLKSSEFTFPARIQITTNANAAIQNIYPILCSPMFIDIS